MSADHLKELVEKLIETNMLVGLEVDLIANYLLSLPEGTDPARRALCETLYYILTSDYEIRLFLESMQDASKAGKYSNLYKYLAIQIYENLNEMPRVLNKLWRSTTSAAEIDVAAIQKSSKTFSKDLRGQIKLLKLNDELSKIRNNAGGHHFDQSKNISYLLEINSLNRGSWGQGAEFYNNAIIALGVYTCVILYNLSKDVRAADRSGTVDALDKYVLFMQENQDYFSERIEINQRFKTKLSTES
jgi:hypothetical protein